MKSTVILLKKIKYGEKNLILQTYTKEEGSKAFFVGSSLLRGKSKSSLPSLSVLEIISSKGKGDLMRAKEIELKQKNYELISNVHKSSLVMFINEVLLKAIGDYDRDEILFDFITTSLNILDQQQENEVNFHLKFMLELSKYLGFYPNGQYDVSNIHFDLFEGVFCAHQPIHRAVISHELARTLSQLLNCSMISSNEIVMNNKDRRALLSGIIDYYKIHIEKFEDLKSKEVLEAVLS
jgi:DNA repair protein RecO (recombination protein O)